MAIPIWQKQRGPDVLEKLANAVNIAQGIYGISAKSDELELAKQRLAAEKEATAQKKSEEGMFTEKEIAQGGFEVSDKPQQGFNRAFIMPAQGGAPVEAYVKKPILLDPFGLKGLSAEKTKMDIEKAKEEAALGPKPTAEQSKSALFAKRLEQSEQVFSELESSGAKGTSISEAAQRSKLYPEAIKGEEAKKRAQAERNFVNAILRKESGAAISPTEFQSAEAQYFPRIGDTPDVLEQKRQNRALALEGLKAEAGPRAFGAIKSPKGEQQGAAKPSGEDSAAMEWLKSNPNDPRADAIRNKLKLKGLL